MTEVLSAAAHLSLLVVGKIPLYFVSILVVGSGCIW